MPIRRLSNLRRGRELAQVLVLIPLGLIVAVCAVDVLAPPDIHLGPLLVAAPALTAAFAGPFLTAGIGVLAAAALLFIGTLRNELITENLQAQIAALVIVSALVVLFTALRDRDERRLTQSRSVAAVAQQVLLRPLPRRSADLEIATLYLAAEEEAEMGGDLFAAARTTRSTRLIIGDVRGKGLPAYSHAALILGAFHAAAHRQATLPNLARHLDGAIRWDGAQWHTVPEPAPAPGPPMSPPPLRTSTSAQAMTPTQTAVLVPAPKPASTWTRAAMRPSRLFPCSTFPITGPCFTPSPVAIRPRCSSVTDVPPLCTPNESPFPSASVASPVPLTTRLRHFLSKPATCFSSIPTA